MSLATALAGLLHDVGSMNADQAAQTAQDFLEEHLQLVGWLDPWSILKSKKRVSYGTPIFAEPVSTDVPLYVPRLRLHEDKRTVIHV